jgi:hypothetical protein
VYPGIFVESFVFEMYQILNETTTQFDDAHPKELWTHCVLRCVAKDLPEHVSGAGAG